MRSIYEYSSALCNRLSPKLCQSYRAWRQARKLALVQALINVVDNPCPIDDDQTFETLQKRYSGPGPYPYDEFSVFKRGVERAIDLLSSSSSKSPGLSFFEAGCGDGMVSLALNMYGHSVVLADMEDWRDQRAQQLPFVLQNFSAGLPISNDLFDVVFSYNSFEHFDNPQLVFSELVRTTRPGGLLFFQFGPLYASPWGLHAYRTLLMPYSQYLFSEKYIDQKLNELGINDLGKKRNTLQPLNRWTVSQFEELWKRDDLEVISVEFGDDMIHLNLITEFPEAFQGRDLTLRDLTTHMIRVILQRK